MLNDRVNSMPGKEATASPRQLVADNLKSRQLQQVAQEFLAAWQQAHGATRGAACALAGPQHVALVVENAFSQAEHLLAQQADGSPQSALLQQYVDGLIGQLAPALSARVEDVTGQTVAMNSLVSNIEQDWLMIFFKLDQPLAARW